jgi:hypothetical protein
MKFFCQYLLIITCLFTFRLNTSCNEKQENINTTKVKTEKLVNQIPKNKSILSGNDKSHFLLNGINNLSNNNEIKLIKFHYYKNRLPPGDKGYKRLTSITPAQIISQKRLNDSTLFVKTEAVYDLQSFIGIAGCSNDTIYIATDRDTTKQMAAAYIKYNFEYTIRIKRGNRYTIAMFSDR